jgi:dihydrofolate reductase
MKTILYMAITPNGLIAKADDDTSWVTDNEWKSFLKMVQQAGNMIIGRRTYEIMKEAGQFKGLEKIKIVVLTHASLPDSKFCAASSPSEALEILYRQGFKSALVAGGGDTNGDFSKEGLIDEIYLDVEPLLFGKGIRLFGNSAFESRLKLLGTKKLSANEVQLHYKVLK